MRHLRGFAAPSRSQAAFYTLGIAGLIIALLRSEKPFPLLTVTFLTSLILWDVQDGVSASSSLGLVAFGVEFVELACFIKYLVFAMVSGIAASRVSLLRRVPFVDFNFFIS